MEEFKGVHLNYYDALQPSIQTMYISRNNIDRELIDQIDLNTEKIKFLEIKNDLYAEKINQLMQEQKELKDDMIGYLKGLNSEIEELKGK